MFLYDYCHCPPFFCVRSFASREAAKIPALSGKIDKYENLAEEEISKLPIKVEL